MDLQVQEINAISEPFSSPISSVNAYELVRVHNKEEAACFQLGQRRGPASFLNELQIKLPRSGPPSRRAGINQGMQQQPAALPQEGRVQPAQEAHPALERQCGLARTVVSSFSPRFSTIPCL